MKVMFLLACWAAGVALVKMSAVFAIPTCVAGYLLGYELARLREVSK